MLGIISLLIILTVAVALLQCRPAARKPAAESVRSDSSSPYAFLGRARLDELESYPSKSLSIAEVEQIDFAPVSPEALPLDQLLQNLKAIIQEATATKADKPAVLGFLRDAINEQEAFSASDRDHIELFILETAQDHLHFDLTLAEVQSLWPNNELSKSNPYETNLTN